MKKLLFLLILTAFIASCKNDTQDRIDEQEGILQEYFADNNITGLTEVGESGVYYKITEDGNGEDFPALNSTVRVFYKGSLLDGSVFDEAVEGEDDYLQIPLNRMIAGWQLALPNFSKGAKGEIYIPSHAGYGGNEQPGIPAHSIIVFEVYLFNVF